MKNKLSIIIIFLVFFIDQLSKFLINKFMYLGEEKVIIKNFFSLTYVENNGAAFGMFKGKLFLIISISIILLIYLIREIINNKDNKLITISLSFIVGGLVGNLFDRIFFSGVKDFLDFTIFKYSFAIFNLGDVFIVVGSIMMIVGMILFEKQNNY